MLIKPPFTPSAVIFRVVWTVLYILMALSFIFYIRKEREPVGMILFFSQLLLNLLWGLVFFKLHLIKLSLVMIFLMIILVLLCILLFYRRSKTAGILLFPYFLWLFLAFYLNFGLILLN